MMTSEYHIHQTGKLRFNAGSDNAFEYWYSNNLKINLKNVDNSTRILSVLQNAIFILLVEPGAVSFETTIETLLASINKNIFMLMHVYNDIGNSICSSESFCDCI